MLNLVKAQMEDVEDPVTGRMVPGLSLLQRYSKRFMPVLFRNGGHPVMMGRKVGGYINALEYRRRSRLDDFRANAVPQSPRYGKAGDGPRLQRRASRQDARHACNIFIPDTAGVIALSVQSLRGAGHRPVRRMRAYHLAQYINPTLVRLPLPNNSAIASITASASSL